MSQALDLTSTAVTQALMTTADTWRVRAVERLDFDSADSCRRRRSLQVAPLRLVLEDSGLLHGRRARQAEFANLVLPVLLLPKGPLVDLDLAGPLGPGQLIPRIAIAERQAATVVATARSVGLGFGDDGVLGLTHLLGFSEGPWRATAGRPRALERRRERYLLRETDSGDLPDVIARLAPLSTRAGAVLSRRVLMGTAELSAMEHPFLVFPQLMQVWGSGPDAERRSVAALESYVRLLERAGDMAQRGSAAADVLLNTLADYGHYWHLMAQFRVPLDEPFLLKYEERRTVRLSWLRNQASMHLVIADASSNHVTARITDAHARMRDVHATDPLSGTRSEFIATSSGSRELHAVYVWDDNRPERVELTLRIVQLFRVAVASWLLVALAGGVAALFCFHRPESLGDLGLIAGPTALTAGLLLTREPSTLGSRLRRSATVGVLVALLALMAASGWRTIELLRDADDHGQTHHDTTEEMRDGDEHR
jgi:hypothetical protein